MAEFTPQEIEQFLQQFFDVVGARQYIGARYVPIFGRAGSDTVEWDDFAPYEPLTVVMHAGVSYVSRRYVPAGIPITDASYWVETYRFNAQVEQYRQQVLGFADDIADRVPFPDPAYHPKFGTLGQVLSTLADGSTVWSDPVVPSDEQAEQIITAWLDEHPEATTTVLDGAITTPKLADGSVTNEKLAANGIYNSVGFASKYLTTILRPGNLVSEFECVDGYAVNITNGSLQSLAGYFATGYVPVSAGITYRANVTGRRHAWYDASRGFLSGADNVDFQQGVTAPASAAFLRFTIRKSQDFESPYEVYFAEDAQYQPDANADLTANHALTSDSAGVAYVVPWIGRFPGNLIEPTECVDGYAVRLTDGSIQPLSGYFVTGYVPVTADAAYKANVRGRIHAWYDATKTFLSGADGIDFRQGVTAPASAAFLRFTIRKSQDFESPYEVYFASSEDYDDNVTIDNLYLPNEWCRGKTVDWLGDSIVDGADFDEMVCDALGMTKLTQDGVDGGINGSTISLRGDGTDTRNAICVRYANIPTTADIVLVSAGTNDFEYAWAPIGTIEDPDDGTSNTTFYGALKTLCRGLIDMFPQKVIAFTTPIKRAQPFESGHGGTFTPDGVPLTPFSKNEYGLTLGDYADIIKEVCGLYSIPCLDLYRESGLNPHLASQADMFDSVGTHPNDAGRRMMARRVCGWLSSLEYEV